MEPNKMARKGKRSWAGRLVPVGVLVVAAAIVAAVAMMPASHVEPKVVDPPPTNVTVEVVRTIDQVEETFDLPGSVEPNRVVRVSAEVPGRIESYGIRSAEAVWQGRSYPKGQPIDEGQPVREGDVLVRLNRDILEAEVERADAQYRYEQSELKRLGGMQSTGATTARELSEAETKAAVSRAVLKTAREQLNRTTIHSPISGVINRMVHEVGEYVQAGMQIAEIVEIDPVKVVVDAPERDVPYLAVGHEAEIFLGKGYSPLTTTTKGAAPSSHPHPEDSMATPFDFAQGKHDVAMAPSQSLTGRITYISELADSMTRSSRVEITIPNPEHRLRSGQIVRVRLGRGLRENVVMIPLMAVMPLEQGYEVFVVRDGLAESRKVNLGFIQQDRVRIEGLAEGDQLIVQGHRSVATGQKVNVVRPARDTATVRGEAGHDSF